MITIARGFIVAGCSVAAPAPSTAPSTQSPAAFATPGARAGADAAPTARPPAPADPGTRPALTITGFSTGTDPLGSGEIAFQLTETERIVSEITGGDAMKPCFQFPYANNKDRASAAIAGLGYDLNVSWTCDSHGWNLGVSRRVRAGRPLGQLSCDSHGWNLGVSGPAVARRCPTEALPHEITLLHVGAPVAVSQGRPMVIDWSRHQGDECVTVEHMLQP